MQVNYSFVCRAVFIYSVKRLAYDTSHDSNKVFQVTAELFQPYEPVHRGESVVFMREDDEACDRVQRP